MPRKKIALYVFRNYGTSVVCSDPIFGDEEWRTQLGIHLTLPYTDEAAASVHISGLGEVVFNRHFEFVRGVSRDQLETNLNKVLEMMRDDHLCPTCHKAMRRVDLTGPDGQPDHDWVCDTCDARGDDVLELAGYKLDLPWERGVEGK